MNISRLFATLIDPDTGTNSRGWSIYLITLFSILLITCLKVDFNAVPFEDAAILMRYADHFSQGMGFVWNPGEKPVDGATDFLFVLVVGLLTKITGSEVPSVIYFVNIVSHVISIMLVFTALLRLLNAPLFVSIATAGFVACGPGSLLISAQFGTPFFALTASFLWFIAIKIMIEGKSSFIDSLSFGFMSLTVGLSRPEGVFLSLFVLIAVVMHLGLTRSLNVIKFYLLTMLLVGGSYFLWRWDYFGYPIPNPYYMKKSEILDLGSLRDSVQYSLRFLFPFLPFLLIGLTKSEHTKKLIAIILPVIGYTLIFSMIDGSMNFAGRFQYVNMFLIAMGWWMPLGGIQWGGLSIPKSFELTRFKKVILSIVVLYILGAFALQLKYSTIPIFQDGRYEVGNTLKDYSAQNLKLACSEAGLIPFYSKLKTLDTWGLNDQGIAHAGLITDSIISRYNPDLIMFHGSYTLLTKPLTNSKHDQMGAVLKKFADANNYELVANFGVDLFKSHFYYLRRDVPNFHQIVKRIKSIEYIWYENGKRCLDFTEFKIAR